MAVLRLLLTLIVAFVGLSNGDGVLPDGPLNASVGGTFMFQTNVNPTETPFLLVNWEFSTDSETKPIISSLTNVTTPEYEDRVTVFMYTGSLELRNLKQHDSGLYRVTIVPAGETSKPGSTTLNVYEPVSNVKLTPRSEDLVEFNDSVSLNCSASGSSPSFQWMKDDSEVTASDMVQITDGGSTLTIDNVTRDDNGVYRCHVYNAVSNGTSDPADIVVSYGPERVQINVSLSKEHHKQGSNVTLSCSADSRPSATFSWFWNKDPLPDNGSELRMINITTVQSGNYSCQAYNKKTLRNQASEPLAVYVHEPVSNVKLTPQGADLVELNDSVILHCSASGSSLSFEWMKDNSKITASDRVQITDGGSALTIVNVTRHDQGAYSCRVVNPVSDETSGDVNLSISYGPENIQLDVSPLKEYHAEGSNISLNCSAESKPLAQYSWFLNGDSLDHSGQELTLGNIQTKQGGNYSCESFNSKTMKRITSQTSVITVLERISKVLIKSDPTNLVEFNSSVSFICSSSGSSPRFTWMKGGADVSVGGGVHISDGGSNLTIVNVTRYDQGVYKCAGSNPVSSASSDPVNITVYYGPEDVKLTKSPSQEYYTEGSKINLSCSAHSQPVATFQWRLNDETLSNSEPNLLLTDVQMNNAGNYTCLALNSRTLRYVSSSPVTVLIESSSSGLSAGVIAAIVIVCLVLIIALGVVYYINVSKKKTGKKPSSINLFTITGGKSKENEEDDSEEIHYARLKHPKKREVKKNPVDWENTSSEYAQIRVNNNRSEVSSPHPEEQNYAKINVSGKKNQGFEPDTRSPEYAQINVKADRRPVPPPKTYKLQTEEMRRPAPQQDANKELYAQVNRSQRRQI